VVTSAVTLNGYTAATFGTYQAAAFKGNWAAYLSVSTSAIVITQVSNVGGAGRHLSQTGVTVSFAVTFSSSTAANAAIVQLTTYPASSLASLQSNGLPLLTAIPSVAVAPTAGSSIPPDVSSGLVPTAAPPTSASAGRAPAALLAGAVAAMALMI